MPAQEALVALVASFDQVPTRPVATGGQRLKAPAPTQSVFIACLTAFARRSGGPDSDAGPSSSLFKSHSRCVARALVLRPLLCWRAVSVPETCGRVRETQDGQGALVRHVERGRSGLGHYALPRNADVAGI